MPRIPTLLLLAIALLAAPPPQAAAERVRVAVLPIVVHSLDDQAHLREGLADMLASRLSSQARLSVLPVRDPAAATTDPTAARAAGRSQGVDYVVFGSFTHFGRAASLDLQCAATRDEADEARRIFIESDTLGELIPKLAPLAERVSRYVTGSERDGAGATAPVAGEPPAPGELESLRRRVEALERALAADGGREPGDDAGGAEPAPPVR